MAKFLRVLLDANEPMFSATLRQLEKMTGRKGVDVAYIADITARAHALMRKIGLDPTDTSEHELYRALLAHVDDTHLFAQTDDVALIFGGSRVVSFNYDDVKENVSRPYESRTYRHMRCQVQHGLTARYIAADGDDEIAIDEMISQSGIKACDLIDYHEQKLAQKTEKTAPSILCIGDIFTDVSIRLHDDGTKVEVDGDGLRRLSVPVGVERSYEQADAIFSVGPAANASVSMACLGAQVGLMSWLGDDRTGKDSLEYLARKSVDTTPLVVQKKMPSSVRYVLRYEAGSTPFVKNETYDYVWKKPKTKPNWIYLATLSNNSWEFHLQLIDYLEANPDVKFAFHPGVSHLKWGAKKLARLYRCADVVVMNREAAAEVTGRPYGVIRQLAEGLRALGPKRVVITDGLKGSYAFCDGKLQTVPIYPDSSSVCDRTGAGDAFASTIVGALAFGESFEVALKWAPINSMSVVQQLGGQAGLLTKKEIEIHLKRAPKSYKIEEYTR